MVKAVGRAFFECKPRKQAAQTGSAGASVGKPGILAALVPPSGLPMNRRTVPPLTLHQAAEGSPTLASLIARARDAGDRLRAVEGLIPPAMRPAVQAGPAEGDVWCLLVNGSAAAA